MTATRVKDCAEAMQQNQKVIVIRNDQAFDGLAIVDSDVASNEQAEDKDEKLPIQGKNIKALNTTWQDVAEKLFALNPWVVLGNKRRTHVAFEREGVWHVQRMKPLTFDIKRHCCDWFNEVGFADHVIISVKRLHDDFKSEPIKACETHFNKAVANKSFKRNHSGFSMYFYLLLEFFNESIAL